MKVGCAAIFQNQELEKRLLKNSSISCAESTAIDLAMNLIANSKSSKFIKHFHSRSVFQALLNKNSTSLIIRLLLDKMNTISKNNSIILTWLLSHVGIYVNKRTDRTAKSPQGRYFLYKNSVHLPKTTRK